MKLSIDNYSDFKYPENANRRFILQESVNKVKKEQENNKHSFIVDWQIPTIEIEENISLISAPPRS